MNFIEQKYSSFKRYLMWHFFAKKLGLIHVVEYPKSGGTWMTQLLADYLDMYYPRNVIPKFKTAVIHGHYIYNTAFNKTILVIRDGRDVAVSYYHHLLLGNDRTPQSIINHYRSKVGFTDYENVKENLPEFITFLNEKYTKRINRHRWSDFIETYLDKEDVYIVRYEDMLQNGEEELKKALAFVGIDTIDDAKVSSAVNKFSFKNQAKRKQGEENKKSFLRKGISGDWKNYFTKESGLVFNKYNAETMKKLGYIESNDWINELN